VVREQKLLSVFFLHFLLLCLGSTSAEGTEAAGVHGVWRWDYRLLSFSEALCIALLVQMLRAAQLGLSPATSVTVH